MVDSPWFWVLAFSALGAALLLLISPKYAQRQGRLDRMSAARDYVYERGGGVYERGAGSAGTSANSNLATNPTGEVSWSSGQAASPANLTRLVWLLALVAVVAALRLVRTSRCAIQGNAPGKDAPREPGV